MLYGDLRHRRPQCCGKLWIYAVTHPIIAGVIFVCGLGFSDGLTFTIAGTSVTLTALAVAAIAGIFLNAVLPGNDYHFGKDITDDEPRY